MLYQQIECAQTDLRNHNKLDSPFACLAVGDKDVMRTEELRSANEALKEDPFDCNICDKED
jgi:hypothetical protein